METNGNSAVVRYTQWIIRWRYLVILVSILATFAMASGGRFLGFDTNYRVFFSKENPQLIAFEAMQDIYTKNDNILFVLAPKEGAVFTQSTLDAVEKLTADAWKIPYAIRVDAISNFQHSYAEGDELIVDDLVYGAAGYDASQLDHAKGIALAEPLLRNRLVSEGTHVTGINVTLQLPGETQLEVPEAVAYSRDLADTFRGEHPDIDVYITGIVMLNNAFSESGQKDLMTLMPLMYLGMIVVMILLLRSVAGTFATVMVIALSTASAMGLAGWVGTKLTPPSASAPTMIMTLAVADSIHILITMFGQMRQHGMAKRDAIVESMRINMQPIFLTSLTTCIGFLSMNFSDAPPFRDLGNMTATGVALAFVFSVTFLPALMAILPVRVKARAEGKAPFIDHIANFVIRRRKSLLWGSTAVFLLLAAFIPANELNDQFVEYFSKSIPFRTDSDFTMDNLTGVYQVEFSLESGEENGVSNPEYLQTLDTFAAWYEKQPKVQHVSSFSTIMKRLNKNLHADDPEMYRVPDNRELAAQYLLLYEMSLPFGLDLNNQVNIDKSATRFTVTLDNMSSREIQEAAYIGEAWLRENAPEHMHTIGVGSSVMFSNIAARNIRSMLGGTTIALIIISFSLIFALRSFKYGTLSLVPNLVPAILAFGLWGILVGQIGLGLSVVMGMTLGIVVDDTVHFLSKYLRARRERKLGAEDAVRYAFSSVGVALVVTSIILAAGFMVLSQSSFKLNSGMGQLTAITIIFALVADFLLLPPLLISLEKNGKNGLEREVGHEKAKLNTAG